MCTLDSAQLHHTCILGVSVDMIAVYEYIQCQSCVSHKEKCPTILLKKFKKKWKSTSVSTTQMNMVTTLMELFLPFSFIFTLELFLEA